ncbi:methionine gamma-lyase [Sulfitobacter mediterraneus]|uniref:methionine gamma-lyase n=1 Tax=Sulfitobacter mediterraneus TaxID=83219 RepID=UPI001933D0A3|nr:methionine gamma-lyase [Sulfitobacter mediterraneus]MBM1635135.1 methionine gamma-lyase [Sulfitobacter mediterraneus]MBM1642959.1 methionine gamma-lyase [Sulfitobacter mediterraneus]MBM1647007.1 methionine gamma-lyase [Sulfitobacter mediterraneus]MBM1651049.1 methionine gamma-lyase [Sulfitobacter mediterraneus]MBM1655050.1 methionine gamma-lyase [Sulfitobacter mediterraneus]
MRSTDYDFSTRAIHHGYDPQSHQGALNPPIYMTSTFTFDTAESGGAMFAGEKEGHFYSRISNPTLDHLEQRIANLEGGEAGLCTASGMGAITSTLWSFLEAGDEVIIDKTLYGCTFAFMTHGLPRFGVKVTLVDMTNPDNLTHAISEKTKIVYFETPANPNNRLVDIAAISQIARRTGAKVVVDNTYATPVITRPLEHGADIVVHSATKFLSGHGDVVAGLIVGSLEDITRIRLVGLKDMTGAVMSPMTAMLLLRGIKTLELRMERHCKTAAEVAQALEAHPAVLSVSYPGLDSFAQRDLARRQMANFGGMIPFEVKGGKAGGIALMNRLTLIQRAVSLGDAESLIQHPASMTHSTYTPEERAEHGIAEGLVRLSVGLEGAADLINDLHAALGAHNMQAA